VAVAALKGLLPQEGFARLTPLGGFEARVYTDGERVYKVYGREEAHLAALEAKRMARAGLGSLVLGVVEVEGQGVLVTRRFPGRPFSPQAFTPKTLAALSHLFLSLHRLPEPGVVSREELLERLERFAESLFSVPEALDLVKALKKEVELAAGVERRFCHRDAWAGNLLLKEPGAEGLEVILVDWVRSGGTTRPGTWPSLRREAWTSWGRPKPERPSSAWAASTPRRCGSAWGSTSPSPTSTTSTGSGARSPRSSPRP
jgi:thiamine kinase